MKDTVGMSPISSTDCLPRFKSNTARNRLLGITIGRIEPKVLCNERLIAKVTGR